MGDKRGVIIVGVLVVLVVGPVLLWRVQGGHMVGDFAEAMRAGRVEALPPDLVGKEWSEEELATVHVLKLPGGYGREGALSRSLQTGGEYTVSREMYAYQATMRDADTGIKHLFGYRRRGSGGWCWAGVHPDSMELHIQRRGAEAGQPQGRRRGP